MNREHDHPQFDEWRSSDGKFHDGQFRTFERKRDMLQLHAERCGCFQCKRRYESYMLRIQEDHGLIRSAVMWMNYTFWTLRGYKHDDLEIFDDGDVQPIRKRLRGDSLGDPDE